MWYEIVRTTATEQKAQFLFQLSLNSYKTNFLLDCTTTLFKAKCRRKKVADRVCGSKRTLYAAWHTPRVFLQFLGIHRKGGWFLMHT
jgi:hypothetical protein